MPAMTIFDALGDRTHLGALPVFQSLDSWRAWLTFFAAVYGLPLDSESVARFCQHTGRTTYAPPPGGYQEAVAIVGRQAGKSRAAATIAAFEALTAPPEADGTETYVLLVAQDHRAALRTLFRYAVAPFERVPLLAARVNRDKARTQDTLTLDTNVTLAAYPCRSQAVRGLRARAVICDELAFFRTSENQPVDVEMLRALRPCLATTGGKLIIISSPYGQAGALFELHRRHFGRDDSSTLVWQASAPEMNATLPADYLARMLEEDPDSYRSEVLGQFRAGLALLFDPESIAACVAVGRPRELPPADGVEYLAGADPSGGRGDAFTLAIGHDAGDGERTIVDLCRAWAAPFNPSGVVAEIAETLRRYGIDSVVGDKYSAEWCVEAFRAQGIRYDASDLDRSALYLELLSIVNTAAIELPDEPKLLRELRCLERRRGPSGRDRVDHPRGSHDDRANAVALVAVAAARERRDSGPHLLEVSEGGDELSYSTSLLARFGTLGPARYRHPEENPNF